MIRLQDIADMAGVSRTTVSNVINGNTKRVSQKTIDKITAILKEQNYVPNMGSMMLSGHGSRIIGVVLGFTYAHGMQSLQDPFVGELIGTIQMEMEENGYYVMLIGGESIQNVVDIASKWNVEGLIILGYNEEQVVSTDIIGMSFGSLFDATLTRVMNVEGGKQQVKIIAWYDNEMSYTAQLVRLAEYVATKF